MANNQPPGQGQLPGNSNHFQINNSAPGYGQQGMPQVGNVAFPVAPLSVPTLPGMNPGNTAQRTHQGQYIYQGASMQYHQSVSMQRMGGQVNPSALFTSQPPSQAGPPRMQDGRTLPESCMTDNVTYPCIPVVHNVHDHEGATTLDYKAHQIWGFMKIEKSPGKEVNKARDSLLVSERPILQK